MVFFKRSDVFILLMILIVSLLVWIFYNQNYSGLDKPKIAEIYYYSKLVKTVPLDKGIDKRFTVPENPNVVFHLYEDGSIKIEESNCPNKIGIKRGKISRYGEFAACLPNGIVLKIPFNSQNNDEPDLYVGY